MVHFMLKFKRFFIVYIGSLFIVTAAFARRLTEVIAYQLIKASTSVAANYRAVCRAKSKADFINKLKIVEEESDESLFWLEFIADLELIHNKLLKDLIKESNELVSIFTAALKTSKTNYKSQIPNRKSEIL